MSANTFFYIQLLRSSNLNTAVSYVRGHFKYLVQSPPVENGQTLHQRDLDPAKPFATAPGHLQVCDSPRSELFICALIQVECPPPGSMHICCEF
jgi:hypothetical protein